MKPLLFSPSESIYATFGYGPIDATSCIVTEEANGAFELKLRVPRTTPRLAQLKPGAQILAPPNPYDQAQPFRVKRVSKTQRGDFEVYAQHLAYDLAGAPIAAFTAATAAQAIWAFNNSRLAGPAFQFSTDLSVSNPMVVTEPTSAWDLLGSSENTLTYCYGGELKFDRRSVQLLAARGADRGFVVAYGKNLTELTAEETIEDFYTGVLPFWIGSESSVTGNVQNAVTDAGFVKILPLDLSSQFDDQPTIAQLNAAAQTYITENKIGVPKLKIRASFVPPGSRGIAALEDVRLWDKVTLRHELLNLNVAASVVKTAYDVLRERYDYIEIGNRLVSAAQTIAAPTTRIAKSAVTEKAIARNSVGGSRIKNDSIATAKLGTGAVTGAKLGVGAVTSDKIGTGAVNSAALGLGAVTAEKLGVGAVTVTKIADGAISETKIANGAVTGNKVLDQAISYAKLNGTLQVFYNDIIAANAIYSSVITARGSVTCSTLNLNGTTVTPQQISYMTGAGIAAQGIFVGAITGG